MRRHRRGWQAAAAGCLLPVFLSTVARAQPAEAEEFFEKKIRPVLVKNCQGCHNTTVRTASLDLSTKAGFAAGGQRGPVVSRERPEESRILKVVGYEENLKMPPTGKLKDDEIADIAAWVKMGAPWPGKGHEVAPHPASAAAADFTSEQKSFWSLQPVRDPQAPSVKDAAWARTPIDRFILAKLESKGLKPAAPASKLTLLRRATYDLTGLPPTPEEMRNFAADTEPDAFAKVVDRLLASPRYGERWGRHWLDVARYADTTGNDEDRRYFHSWRYRDYVIEAFNNDLPYEQFVREQVAGDLIPAPRTDEINRRGIIATGFLALGQKAISQQDRMKMMYDIYDDQVDVMSKAFLGLTISCARCHNHKFDPILTRDYYSLVSIFASTQVVSDRKGASGLLFVPLVPKAKYEQYRAQQDRMRNLRLFIEDLTEQERVRHARIASSRLAESMIAAREVYRGGAAIADVSRRTGLPEAALTKWVEYLKPKSKLRPHLAKWEQARAEDLAATAREYQAGFLKTLDGWAQTLAQWRTEVEQKVAAGEAGPSKPDFVHGSDRFFDEVYFSRGPLAVSDKELEPSFSTETREKVAALRQDLQQRKASAIPDPELACGVMEGKPAQQKVFIRGDYNNPGEDAPKGFPRILARPGDPVIRDGSGRLQLAAWLTSPENPLTARVMVNRIWQWHFGEGLVRTPDNFGKMGDRPTHPELLDYLARRFVASGWSMKALHRTIMLSRVYQMASVSDDKSAEADPENLLLSRFPRRRLDVEEIHDGLLAIAGSLDLTMGGALQNGPEDRKENSADRLSLDPTKIFRRVVYVPLRRANLPGMLNLFDFGDATTVGGKRALTNVAPQALFMMNSEFVFERAGDLAKSLAEMSSATDAERLRAAYWKVVNREPEGAEIDAALTYIDRFAAKPGGSSTRTEAWRSFCHILMASNDFIYVD